VNRVQERLLLVLVVCVPVPALALSGLNVPLPSVVERVAAALVPFAGAAALNDGATLASGAIVHAPGQEVQSTSRRVEPKAATTLRVVRSGTARTRLRPRQVEAVRSSNDAAKPGPTTTDGEEPKVDVPDAPVPVPEAPAPTAPTDSDEQPTGEGEEPTPPVEPDPEPEPNDEADVAPTVEPPDVKLPDVDVPPVPVPDPKPHDLPHASTGDEGLSENAVNAADSTSGT
jgi:hypothetical protein